MTQLSRDHQLDGPLLDVRSLSVRFGSNRVVDDVSFAVAPGQTLAIVGESGSGKSVTSLAIMRLIDHMNGTIDQGEIRFGQGPDPVDIARASQDEMRRIRGKDVAMIFQEPMTSLNPVFTVGDQIAEVLMLHEGLPKSRALTAARELLEMVRLPDAAAMLKRYPHQLSGGMRQRVMIAMALACRPSVLIADEPTTALDVTVQAQIFDLLKDLQDRSGTAIIMITHDMGAIAEMADRVVVMYAGRQAEEGPVAEILERPRHPYTQGLIACVPHLTDDPPPERLPLTEIPGVVPPLTSLGRGCAFAARCPQAFDRCRAEAPPAIAISPGHHAACWLNAEDPAGTGAKG